MEAGFLAWLLAASMGLGEAAVSPTAPFVVGTRMEVSDPERLGGPTGTLVELQTSAWIDFHAGTTGRRAGPYFDLSLGYTGGPAFTAPSFSDGYLSWRAGLGAARRLAAWYALGSGTLIATGGVEGNGPNGAWWKQGPSVSMLAGLRLLTGFHAPVHTSIWYTMVPVTWGKTFNGLHLEHFGHRLRVAVSYKALSVGVRLTTSTLYSRDDKGTWRDLGEQSFGLIVAWRPKRRGPRQ